MAHGAYLLLKFSAFSLTEFAIFLWALWALLICDPLFMGETSAGGASTGGVFDGTPPPCSGLLATALGGDFWTHWFN